MEKEIMETILNRVNELRMEVQQRQVRLNQFIQANEVRVRNEKALIQQKLGAIQELESLARQNPVEGPLKVSKKEKKTEINPPDN